MGHRQRDEGQPVLVVLGRSGDWGATVAAPVGGSDRTRRHHWMPGKGKPREGPSGPRREKDDKPGRRRASASSASSARTRSTTSTTRTWSSLRKFVSERGKIRARRVTGNCVQHQRDVAPPSRTPARWPSCRTRADEDHPAEARRQARRPRRRRRGRRRLRAQLPGPARPGRQGGEGCAEARREPQARARSRQSKEKVEFEALASKLIASQVRSPRAPARRASSSDP